MLSQEVPLPALNPTNFVISRKDPMLVFVGTLGTFHCNSYESRLGAAVMEEERKKRGYDSQLVLHKLRLKQDKGLVAELKTTNRFNMQTRSYGESADMTTLKESADGASLIFLSNNRTLVFDPLTLQLTHNLNHRLLDILGSTVLL